MEISFVNNVIRLYIALQQRIVCVIITVRIRIVVYIHLLYTPSSVTTTLILLFIRRVHSAETKTTFTTDRVATKREFQELYYNHNNVLHVNNYRYKCQLFDHHQRNFKLVYMKYLFPFYRHFIYIFKHI